MRISLPWRTSLIASGGAVRASAGTRLVSVGVADSPSQPIQVARERCFYRWSEVAPWLRDRLGIDIPDADPALVVANLVLQARQHRDRVVHMSALDDLLAA
jgi:hypothetical protein